MKGRKQSPKRNDIQSLLNDHRTALEDFKVKSLLLFGSVARNEANVESDVDLLVEFEQTISLFTFARLQRYLETILDCKVDLGTPDSLKAHLREAVLQEAVRVF
ncbi:MAG: nucleotidyltransferase family protein [Cyanobacteria bacterium J06588_4]